MWKIKGFSEATIVWEQKAGLLVEMIYLRTYLKREPNTLTESVIAPGLGLAFLSLLYIMIPRNSDDSMEYLLIVLLTQVQFLDTVT